jgi:acid phosphatase type 7
MPPVRFAPGNHDTLFARLKRYENYCSPPPSEVASASRLWYRVDMENIHFLVLDLGWSAENYSTGQAAWLEDQLKIVPKSDWKIVLSHGFYYASGFSYQGWKWYDNPETISRLTPLFEKYGVNLVFSGHIHDLELLEHAGVTYAVCGGFGGKLDPQRTYQSPASLWYKAGQFGFLDVTIEGNQADLTFRSPDSTVLRSFRISKGLADSAY